MKVYFDLVFILNLLFDFLLLLSVSFILKRNVKIRRIFLGALVGSFSTLFMFFKINSLFLFFIKILLSVFMIFCTFSYKNFKYFLNNFVYLYLCSIVLGGGLYLIDNNIKLNLLIIFIMGPVILYFYIMESRKIRNNYNNYYNVTVLIDNKKYYFTAFFDSGNKLKDPYKKRPIILVYTDKIDFSYEKSILVPYETISGRGLIKCIVTDKVIIEGEKELKDALIGKSKEKFNIEGIDMILNNETL